MTTEIGAAGSMPAGVRILAVLLIAGGIIGIGLSIWMAILGMQQPVLAVFAVVFAAAFAFTAWQGVKLWKGTAGGYKWAKILFAAQIPSLSLGGLSYGFYTLLGFNIQAGSGVDVFDFNVGSALNIMYSPEAQPAYVGVNLIGLAAFAYLHLRTRTGAMRRLPNET